MPVCLHRDSAGRDLLPRAHGRGPRMEFRESSARCLEIGLLNNMPDGALQSTERQFLTLLDSAAAGLVVRLSFYALPEVPRSEAAQRRIGSEYSVLADLRNRALDGLIVTGAEPRAAQLADEPYWASLAGVVDWAEENTRSTVWSCLAAHAAVLRLDGIRRRRLPEKRFGLFACMPACDHPLTGGFPMPSPIPHSRWNDLPEKDLRDAGYRVLSWSQEAGVDAFAKQKKSLMVFFQGHPEYEAPTLLIEYRRDIGRFLRGERDTYPQMPAGYFGAETRDALTAFRERALAGPREELLAHFPTELAERRLANPWHATAARLYQNWLAYLCEQKERRLRLRRGHAGVAAERELSLPRFAAGA